MAHPYDDIRENKVERRRVDKLYGGTSKAGASDAVQAKKIAAGRKDGGAVKKADGGQVVTGSATKGRADRPSRARGGAIKRQEGGAVDGPTPRNIGPVPVGAGPNTGWTGAVNTSAARALMPRPELTPHPISPTAISPISASDRFVAPGGTNAGQTDAQLSAQFLAEANAARARVGLDPLPEGSSVFNRGVFDAFANERAAAANQSPGAKRGGRIRPRQYGGPVYDLHAAERAAAGGGGGGRPSSVAVMPVRQAMDAPSVGIGGGGMLDRSVPTSAPTSSIPAGTNFGGLRLDLLTPANRAAVEAALSGRTGGMGAIGPQPFGTASVGGMDAAPGPMGTAADVGIGNAVGLGGIGSGIHGGFDSSGVPNTGGLGISPGESVASRGEGVLGGFSSANPGISLGGHQGVESGFNASAGLTGPSGGMNIGIGGLNPSSGLAQSQAEAIDSSSAVTGALSSISPGDVAAAMAASSSVAVSPSGVVSIGGNPVGVVSGSPADTGGGGLGSGVGSGDSGMGGIGLGGVSDGSSNAGIGGPGGTGAVGGAGDAGQGTGGPGEGDRYGGSIMGKRRQYGGMVSPPGQASSMLAGVGPGLNPNVGTVGGLGPRPGWAYKLGGRVKKRKLGGQVMSGNPSIVRADRPHRASGGRVNKKGTTIVNINIEQQEPRSLPPPMPPMLAGGPPVPPPPGAQAGLPPMPPPGMPPGGPPGMPMRPPAGGPPVPPGRLPLPPRAAGGRTYKKGGRVKAPDKQGVGKSKVTPTPTDGTRVFQASIAEGTDVTPQPMKSTEKVNLDRGKQITYKTGGAINAPKGKAGMAPHLPGGARGGLARLAKARMAD